MQRKGLKEAKAIDKVSVTFLSRFILQNFESKDKNDVLSEDSIRNKYYSPTGKAINSTIATLNSIIDQLKKIKEKI